MKYASPDSFYGSDNNSNGQDIVQVDWYIMPLLNPDGYEYTHDNDRLWNKNRRQPTLRKLIIKSIDEVIIHIIS